MKFEKITKKSILLSVAGVTLCAAIVLGIILASGGVWPNLVENNGTTETIGSTGGNESTAGTYETDGIASGDESDPSMGTEPSEGNKPSEETDPSEEVTEPAPTEPSETTPAPTEPAPTEPVVTNPAPTEPPVTEPEPVPTYNPNLPQSTQPPKKEVSYDFGNTTPLTLTADVWGSWNIDKQLAFMEKYPEGSMTPQERHNYMKATKFGGYSCTEHEGHCKTEAAHNRLLKNLSESCQYCGESNCSSYTQINPDTLYYETGACTNYSEVKDPVMYCQTCGKPKVGNELTKQCTKYRSDCSCWDCGVWVKAGACHTCKQEDIDKKNSCS